MIDIKVNPKVIVALAQAFPKPPNSAKRALDNYVNTLTTMLMESLSRGSSPYEVKLNLFSVSLHELANRGGQIGAKKIRLHAWLRDNNLALVKAVEIGSNLTGTVSKVAFTDLVELVWHEPEITTDEISVDGLVIEKSLLMDQASQSAEIFNLLYPDFVVSSTVGTFDTLFDTLDIDVSSLQNYIRWLKEEAKHYTPTRLSSYLFQARIVLAVAQHTGGKYYQRKKPSVFGRMYYAGTSVQNVNKLLRRAMLGDCWEYDIRSSVVAWKMGFADQWVKTNRPNMMVCQCFSYTLTYLEHKDAFVKNVQTVVFGNNSDHPVGFQLKLLKQAFTALSFGARKTGVSWQVKNGEWVNSAIADIFKVKDERERFINDFNVCGFVDEQESLDTYLFAEVKTACPDLLSLQYLQTHSGRPSQSKVIAYLYQHAETTVMDVVRDALGQFDKTVLANIHDAIVVKQRLSADDKHEIELRMQEQTGNPYWRLGATQLERWEPSQKETKKEEVLHKQRMAGFEAVAQGFKGILSRLGFGRS